MPESNNQSIDRARPKLTLKQEKFIDAFMVSGNATEAAKKAGYSTKTAFQTGAENLKKPKIANEIKRRRGKAAKRADVTLEKWIAEVAAIAFADLGVMLEINDETGEIRPRFDGSDRTPYTRLIKEFSQEEKVERGEFGDWERIKKTTIKFYDKIPALNMLAKYLDAYNAQVEDPEELDDRKITFADIVKRARARQNDMERIEREGVA